MKEHEAVRALLSLAAAGALDAAEEPMVRAHAAVCPACVAELAAWQALGEELSTLPAAQPPPALVERTQARVRAVLREEADRRWDDTVLAFLALLTWTVGLATWAVWRLITGGARGVAVLDLTETLTYLTVTTLAGWMTAGVAAIVAGQRRRALWRSI